MRRWLGGLVVVAVVAAGCTSTSGGDGPAPSATPSATASAASLASLGVDWPVAGDQLDLAGPPAAPAGFDDALVDRMAGLLATWAAATTLSPDVWRGDDSLDAVTATLPASPAQQLASRSQASVSPVLAVANVFGDDVTVVGRPRVTTAWKVRTEDDDSGDPYLVLELQTRAAYEVRVGDGPSRVIGVLRVHGLSAYPGTTDDFGASGGWQEFGAGDCALALDDVLVPDGDLAGAAADLATFVDVGDQDDVRMPALDDADRVDADYLQRCRDGST